MIKEKIETRTARIAILGLGYVGLPMCVEFARAGFQVCGIDPDESKVKQLREGRTYILDISADTIASVRANFHPTTDFGELERADAIVICVPTPLRKTKDPDMSYILSATGEISGRLQKGQLIILESTTYPGTTDEIILPELEKKGLKAGVDFYLAFSPERIDPGNREFGLKNTPKIVGGVTPECGALAAQLYSCIVDHVVRVSSTRSAEMVKLLENTFRAINIGMVNEIALMCNRLGIDTWEVIDAAATKPFGYMPFYPGPGLGGHCIPIDPHYLSWKLKTLNYSARFIELAEEINSGMPAYVVGRIADALNTQRTAINGSRILLLGMAYKRNSNDLRESPALEILKLLQEKGAEVSFHDPYIQEIRMEPGAMRSVEFSPAQLAGAACVVIVTDHNWYDWQTVTDHAKMVVDTRNATRNTKPTSCKIFRL